jgi:hypothetical protein
LDEVIIDDVSTKSRSMKHVEHYQYQIERAKLDFDEYRSGDRRYDLTGNNAHWQSWGQYAGDLTRRNIRIIWPKDERTLQREAEDAFYQLNEVDNLLNSVEAPQLVSFARSLYNLVQQGIRVAVKPRKALQGLRNNNRSSALREDLLRRVARDSLKTITNIHLGYAFGVAPLISDMRKLSKATATYKKRLQRLAQTAGTEVSVHRHCDGVVQDYLVPDTSTNTLPTGYGTGPDLGSSYWSTKPKAIVVPVRTATVRGIRNIRYSQDVFTRLDSLIHRFGVTGPASFAWERIPFSFVLDWFVDLSGVLNAVDNALTGSSKRITGSCCSDKWEVLCPIIHERINSINTSIYDGQQVAQVRLSSYTRKPTAPGISIGASGRFGKKQALLTASLVGQMAANLKAKRWGL